MLLLLRYYRDNWTYNLGNYETNELGMIWIIIIVIILVVVWSFIRFFMDYGKLKNTISSRGGVKTIYKPLVDGLLQYPSARILQDQTDLITIGGTFTDPIYNRECGLWSVIIQLAFTTLNVKYQAHHDLDGGEKAKQVWDFPPNMNQEEILTTIKRKADEWDIYGIVK